MKSLINTIVDSGLCHGCGGCVASVPAGRLQMVENKEGFLRPTALGDLSSKDLAIIRSVCSGISLAHEKSIKGYDPLWGPIVKARVGHSSDSQLRYAGSSGGVISTIANFLILGRTVDFVLQVTASKDDPIGNSPLASASRDDVIAAAGSRYAPSATLAEIDKHLASGLRFAVVGKPCDIATLRRMAAQEPRIKDQVPLMISFMCAGVPSRKGTMEILSKLDVEPADLAAFSYRGRGWPGYTRATLRSGEERQMTYKEAWGSILSRHLQPRCKICPDGTGEFADIVCADAWYGKDGYPDFSEANGRSIILSRTAVGEKLINRMLSEGLIEGEALSLTEIAMMQPYQANRKRMTMARLAGLKLLGRTVPRYRRFRLLHLARRAGFMSTLRNLTGTFVRAAQGRFNA